MKQLITTTLLSFFLFNTSFSQDQGIHMSGDYTWRVDISAFDINVGWLGFGASGHGASFSIGGGPSFGNYLGDLSTGDITPYIYQEMSGTEYVSYYEPDDVDGGWSFNTSILYTKYWNNGVGIGIGPRFQFFSSQEVSVMFESKDSQYIYTEFVDVPYRESQWVPGLEINFNFGSIFFMKYAYMAAGEYESNMHMLGAGIIF